MSELTILIAWKHYLIMIAKIDNKYKHVSKNIKY